jgi:hypothetical protein
VGMAGGGAGMAAEAPFLATARCVEVHSGSVASRRTQEGKKGRKKGCRGALATRDHEWWPWHHGGGGAQFEPYPAENGGDGASMRKRKARRSCAQDESENGGMVKEYDAGG